jgi:drug/metabolite transporter (DMT)-like permease
MVSHLLPGPKLACARTEPLIRLAVVDERAGLKVWLALWVVYLVWGSTYLAIRVGVHPGVGHGFPPLLLAGARFTFAGALLLAFAVRRPAPDGRPDPLGPRQWASAAVVGLALLLGGNGLVSIAEQHISSGIAAVVVATVPIWAAVLGAGLGQERIGGRQTAGLLLGFAGVAALVVGGGEHASIGGVMTVVAAALLWAAGSVWSRTAQLVRRPLVMTGMEMVCGGVGCFAAGLISGEAADVHFTGVPTRVWVAVAYLVVAGSMLAYTAYSWLLHNARMSLVTTYAYVNPVVAVLLGALLLDEQLTLRVLIAGAAIVVGVMLILGTRRRGRSLEETDHPPAVETGAAKEEVRCS